MTARTDCLLSAIVVLLALIVILLAGIVHLLYMQVYNVSEGNPIGELWGIGKDVCSNVTAAVVQN